jgi:hypothetical protein
MYEQGLTSTSLSVRVSVESDGVMPGIQTRFFLCWANRGCLHPESHWWL